MTLGLSDVLGITPVTFKAVDQIGFAFLWCSTLVAEVAASCAGLEDNSQLMVCAGELCDAVAKSSAALLSS